MQKFASLAIKQTKTMHNTPTHNKEDTLKQNKFNFKFPKPKINKSKV
jgi:hypothetical protein